MDNLNRLTKPLIELVTPGQYKSVNMFKLSIFQPSMGTNPFSVAAPGRAGDSFQLDMATSAVAFGKVCYFNLKEF